MKKNLIILCPYPHNRIGSQRFRFEQYFPVISEYYTIKQLPFWTKNSINILYSKGNFLKKVLAVMVNLIKRFFQLITIAKGDIVFIHRESMPVGGSLYEFIISKILKKPIIYDFDDAIWNLDVSNENQKLSWLKSTKKIPKIITYSTHIIAGNNYLNQFAQQYNHNTTIIPTTIDTNYHIKKQKQKKDPICIGWTGSKTTIQHFEQIIPVLTELYNKHFNISFRIIGDESYLNESLNIKGIKWSLNSEIDDLSGIDIGIMPLPDDEWTKGKCGFKGLQYMALEIPTVMSPVGVNNEIIDHNHNGFLANTDDEWINYLSQLIESKELREKLGKAGRKTVEAKYSLKANSKTYLDILNQAL